MSLACLMPSIAQAKIIYRHCLLREMLSTRDGGEFISQSRTSDITYSVLIDDATDTLEIAGPRKQDKESYECTALDARLEWSACVGGPGRLDVDLKNGIFIATGGVPKAYIIRLLQCTSK